MVNALLLHYIDSFNNVVSEHRLATCNLNRVTCNRLFRLKSFHHSPYLLHIWLIQIGAFKTLLRSEEHTSELQSRQYLVCRLLLEKKNIKYSDGRERLSNLSADVREQLNLAGRRPPGLAARRAAGKEIDGAFLDRKSQCLNSRHAK